MMNTNKFAGTRRLWLRRVLAFGLLAGGIGAVIFFYHRNPFEEHLTICMFHTLTGLHCPGCGMTRAAWLLLHGQIGASLRMNPFFIPLMVLLGWMAVANGLPYLGFRSFLPPLRLRAWHAIAALAILIVFSIVRNIPGSPLMPV